SYRLSQNWSVRGEYQFIDGIGDGSIGQADSHFTSIGLTYHFNQQAPVIEPTPIEPATRYVTIEKPLSLSAQTLFAFDSTTVVTNQSLDLLVEQLTSYPEDKVQILGYTDNSGSEAYNQRLSEQRAKAVAAYLTEKGIDASRLTVVGKGEANPVASNDTQQGRVQNRRVEVRFDTTINQTLEATDSPNETN
ncbi:TPA: OmpA family protein, partial [Vibrio parahaemolyticus]